MIRINKISYYRGKAGLTQKELAEKLEVTQGAVSKWENGAERPLRKYRVKLVKILGCSEDDLLE